MPYLGQLVGSDHGLFIRHQQMDKKRRQMVADHEHERLVLKSIIGNKSLPAEVRRHAVDKLNSQPHNWSPIRMQTHCIYTKRAMGMVAAFKMSRITFRRLARHSLLPGIWREQRIR
eukprot:Plantae.Rhodophyta-Purpureofilum_apyrenoidigerum.ctg13737.p1 GENE.Plantae.Rhodophyta-Purpureofilum_apyrenoidigerum.ctg13737~~Plantae.Rhodophyta-Purpureofilum_apyrenoidigerum.ctg13737.p1  ORF type:complete len:116 (+),score=7.97 Plantae.Rhodophyta-Purpureofilum_apyrenoidigerum.ctg13737:447-794(+)